jgi:uncharacterized protein
MSAEVKLRRLREIVRSFERLLVAFSGGVDSAFLLRVASEELPGKVVALTIDSPTVAREDQQTALSLAGALGVEHVVVQADELAIPNYAANPVNRCYFCKNHLYEVCFAEAGKRGIAIVADGVNYDDLGDYRPGLKAAQQHQVRHPLAEVELRKAEIRELSRALGLPTWNKPASPCLSSRFPYGTRITHEALAQVASAEQVLREAGFSECRVRYYQDTARIEVPVAELRQLLDERLRQRIVDAFKALGFRYVTVDLQGFRSGSLNEGIAAEVKDGATLASQPPAGGDRTRTTPPTPSPQAR